MCYMYKKNIMDPKNCEAQWSNSTSTGYAPALLLNKVSLGKCLRDEDGNFMISKTAWFSSFCDVDVDDAMGLYTS